MKIRITSGGGWYEGKEGEVFDVEEVSFAEEVGEYIYYVSERGVYDNRRFVRQSNCEVVSEESEGQPNMVDHPPHYNYGDIEVIDYIEQVTDVYPGKQAYLAGNIVKYISRAPHKNGIEDAKKAKWYLERLIGEMEKEALNPPPLIEI